MALIISSENIKDNVIGQGNGGLQPATSYKNGDGSMRLNNGAPVRNGENSDVINYENNSSSVEYDSKNMYQDRVIASVQNEKTNTISARDETYFALHGTTSETDIDNGTELGNVTPTNSFHYVGPQSLVTTDDSTYSWKDGKVSVVDDDDTAASRTEKINQIYMVGSVNVLSAR